MEEPLASRSGLVLLHVINHPLLPRSLSPAVPTERFCRANSLSPSSASSLCGELPITATKDILQPVYPISLSFCSVVHAQPVPQLTLPVGQASAIATRAAFLLLQGTFSFGSHTFLVAHLVPPKAPLLPADLTYPPQNVFIGSNYRRAAKSPLRSSPHCICVCDLWISSMKTRGPMAAPRRCSVNSSFAFSMLREPLSPVEIFTIHNIYGAPPTCQCCAKGYTVAIAPVLATTIRKTGRIKKLRDSFQADNQSGPSGSRPGALLQC